MYCKLPEQLGVNGSSAFDFAAKPTKLRRKMSYSRNRFSLASFFAPRSWRLNRHFCLPFKIKPKIKVSCGLRLLYFTAQCIKDTKRVGFIKAIHFVSGWAHLIGTLACISYLLSYLLLYANKIYLKKVNFGMPRVLYPFTFLSPPIVAILFIYGAKFNK